jgi:hypothetical protein
MADTHASHCITNATGGSLRVCLEPWGDEYDLARGEHAELRIESAAEHPVEWDFRGRKPGDLLAGHVGRVVDSRQDARQASPP